ncbi:chromodomain-helicase-DNA-binding protein 8 isoform X3 [Alligator mississippiensis]|uniref:chromodomain-helicase-DNA-binding protein 8 isoform X3 n=1 Tax=Alligator mississippiensis TaxID=8496 RepID=UPI0028777D82|nr:chromodomain-helicase-DNA-binding protein 8 isoform X3 [Alligator mississippiensis]
MADPIMDLFDDPNLFGLDSLTDEGFSQTQPDPIEEALGLPGELDPAQPVQPPPSEPAAPEALPLPPEAPPDAAPGPAPPDLSQPELPPEQDVLSQGNPFMGVSSTTAASTPEGQAASASQLTPAMSTAPAPKIVILKAPAGGSVTGAHVAQIQAQPLGAANGGKVTFAKVLTGTPLRPGVSIVSGNTVLATKVSPSGTTGSPATVHRLVQPGRPVKQLVLQPVKSPAGGTSGAPLKPAVTLTSAPAQGESKRITLVLQQPQGGSGPPGQRHVVLGSLPGKIVLQGNQLAALSQAKGAPGQPAKVVTIQLQVQQPQGGGQPGAPQKIQLLQQSPATSTTGQPPQPPVAVSSVQQAQVVGSTGQRLTVPLKVVLQPQAGSSQGGSSGLSVVKVLSSSEVAALSGPGTRGGAAEESRKLEHQKKQEKANRIVAEAIARARARGEQNIPRVLNEDELPSVRPEEEGERKRRRKGASDRGGPKEERPRKGKGSGKSKGRSKPSTITPVVGKKRKRNASSDNSDAEVMPAQSPREEEETSVQKRRSNRQVKRKKYTEDLDIKITDDEEDEELDVTGPVRPEQPPMPQPPAPEPEPEGETLPSMQFFVENPSEEDAAIVDKVLAMRVAKKELPSGQFTETEEFFVKYKNYSYLHCEWATIDQLEKDKRIHQKLKRFKTKMTQMRHFFHEDEEPFNPDYVEVDRILDESHSIDKDNGEPVIYYLVKWCSLPYEDSTWELKEDVDEGKVCEFKRIQARHPELKRVARPQAGSWKKLELSHEYKNHNQLREYQLEGVNWLLFNWYNRQNCILADEMGLGKTIQSIAFLQEVYNVGIRGPFLVIAPLSTITNWEREFNTWTEMNSIVYHGSLASRQMIQQYEMYCKDSRGRLIPGAYKFDALITTFEMILSDCPELREIEWRCVIIDEAHRLKNRNCKLLDSLKHMDLEHKVLLTGTPLQNTVEELFSLLHFLEPSQFPSEAEFLKDFGDLKTEEQVQKLQAILKPMMLRRLKEDVEKNLAPKQETIIEVELTNIQKKYYRAILEKNFSFLSKGAGHTNMPNLLNTMMELRKCCNHPYLINGAEEKILAEFRDSCHHHVPPDFHLQAMVRSAGKLVLIDKLLPKLKAGGHKVLIFSQMVRCLDILEDYLIQRRYLYERIDGRVRGNLRQAAIDRFSKPDSDRFVFLLCTRAGGLGINLTAADTCIIFDSDWNPQNDLQAQARCHRIGQSKAVKVYRLITRNSYEREMFDKASLKLGLDKAVLQSMSGREGNITGIQQFSKKEIEDLLRKGAYAAIMEEDDEGSKFCEEDIDQILLRRTTTITIESEGKGSTFAKASFVASENRTDIALDDPNFWQKWAKKADLDLDLLNSKNNLVIDTPRVRKQTRHFSTLKDDDLVEFSDLESEDEERPRSRRHDRHHHSTHHTYGRTDCFRVEKHLLVYGWGRWREILSHGRFKRRLSERDVETICRAILVYCLLHYRGDENIKGFIWDLISPSENGKAKELQNHSGLSIPVPRGRKGKKVKSQSTFDVHKADWIRKYNPDTLFQDESYKKHLKHQCNKVLLRVRMLYYLRQEVIGDQANKVLAGAIASEIDIWFPLVEQLEVPTAWWDAEADKSLLIGVFKHGYEKYNTMRADPALCFLEKAGRPDEKAIAAEQRLDVAEGVDFDKDCEDPEYKPLPGTTKEQDDEGDPLMMLDEEISVVDGDEGQPAQPGHLFWPPGSALTARLRRLITAYQRSYKQEQLKMEAAERGDRRRRRCEAACKLKEMVRREKQQRWTRREQSDFYRVVSSFGVEYDPDTLRFHWGRFRALARLDRKTDESLTKYYHGFVAMCRQVCRLPPAAGDESPDPTLFIEPISEERASRTLYRVDLLRRLREQVLCHPLLQERLALCPPPGLALPAWWECGRHDGELLRGAARHGLGQADAAIMQDPDFSFLAARLSYLHGHAGTPQPPGVGLAPLPPAPEPPATLPPAPLPPSVPPKPDSADDSDSELDLGKLSPSSSGSSSSCSDDSEDERGTEPSCGGKLYEEEESLLSLPTSREGDSPQPSAPELLLQERNRAHDWPKDRALLSRIDLICQAVLTGKWPSGPRGPEVCRGPGEGMARLPGDYGPPAPRVGPPDEAPMSYTRLRHSPEEKEFTVQIKDEEGIKLTFQKHRLVPNGAMRERHQPPPQPHAHAHAHAHTHSQGHGHGHGHGHGQGPPQHLQGHKKSSKKLVELELQCLESLRGPDIDLEARIPVVRKTDGTVLVGEAAPRRADLEAWLQAHPDFAIDPRFLAYMEDRRKQYKWHRCRKPGMAEASCLPGLERGLMPDTPGTKKGYMPDSMLHRLLPGPMAAAGGQKARGRRAGVDLSKMVSLMGGAAQGQLGAMGPLALHSHFQPGPAPGTALPYAPFPAPAASSSATLLHPGLGHGSYAPGPPLHLGHPGHLQPDEDDDEDEDEMDDLSQGYASSERDFSLLDDPMMPANSDSSDGANEEGD